MEKSGWMKVALVSLSVALAGYFVGNMHVKARKFNRFVQVKGLAEREVKADLAVWPIQISLTGNDLGMLERQIDGQKQTVMAFFRNQGFNEEELSVGVTNILDTRAEVYSANAQYREYRYIAKTDFTVRTNQIDRLQKALSESLELISEGILITSKNTWKPIEYIFTGLNSVKPSMVEEATLNAREVAEKFAMDSGSKVGKIKSASQGIFSISDRDMNTPEIKNVRVVSTIEYFLED
jgi:hypothetical protein